MLENLRLSHLQKLFAVRVIYHLVLLTGILLLVLCYVRPLASFFTDEGLAILQARQLENAGTWTYPTPPAELDPTGQATVMTHSEVGEKGRTFYAKHPAYPILLAAVDTLGGRPGMFVLSLAGVVAAAFFTSLIAGRLGLNNIEQRLAFWALAICSPLFMYAYQVLAHSIATALVAMFVWLVLRAFQTRVTLANCVGIFAVLMAATLLRSEVLFLGPACALSLLIFRKQMSGISAIVLAGVCLVSSFSAYAIDRIAINAIVGRPVTAVPLSFSADSWLSQRWDGAYHSLLLIGNSSGFDALPLLATALVVAAGLVSRVASDNNLTIACVAAAAAGLAIAALGDVGAIIPGLFGVCPLLVLMVVSIRVRDVQAEPRLLC